MPHSTSDLPSQVAYAASLKAMTSNPGYSRLNGAGASSTSLDNKWKRASLPVADAYGEYKDLSLRARSGSITSTASTAVIHRKSQYYESNFTQTRDRVVREAPLIAELRTNVIIKDEYTLVTDLSYHLANRYSKPDSAIMINIDHSSCLALAGTFDPCYILTITTIPQHMSSTQNKRNASLIQTFMADILSVPPDRGVVRFVSIPEDNYAINGNTIAGEIERAEKSSGTDGVRRALTDSRKTAPVYKRSASDLERHKANGASDEHSEREKRAERRRSTVPVEVTPPTEVFELAADVGSPAPAVTAQAPTFAAENGLRMNGVSKEELEKLPNGRPKTIAAPSVTPVEPKIEALPPLKPKHISAVAKTDLQKAAHMPKSARVDSKPARQQTAASKTGGTPVTLKETVIENPKVLKSSDTESANTSKRRSTMTAMPKVPAPPPVPETKSPKVGKRKSFLAAFRR